MALGSTTVFLKNGTVRKSENYTILDSTKHIKEEISAYLYTGGFEGNDMIEPMSFVLLGIMNVNKIETNPKTNSAIKNWFIEMGWLPYNGLDTDEKITLFKLKWL